MEDELLENDKTSITPNEDLSLRLQNALAGKTVESTSRANSSIKYNSEVGKSQYDKGLIPSINLDPENAAKSIQEYRSRQQPTSHQIANAAAKFIPNVILGTVGTVASALDIEDYKNSDDEVGNWLTNITSAGQESMNQNFPIYRANPEKPLDLSDGGWWVENLASLGESVASFAIGGAVLSKGLTGVGSLFKGMANMSKAAKAQSLVNFMTKTSTGLKTTELAGTVLQAAMLNQSEGILEAMDVQKEIYAKYVGELGEEDAKIKASEAAATVISTNRLNILLNITSANLFFRSSKFTRGLHHSESVGRNIGRGVVEGAQESAEEIINLIAGNRGRAQGNDEEYGYEEIRKDIVSMEALEAAVLGFAGGMGQTVVTKEGVNRLMKTGDPDNPGKKVSIKEFNKKQFENFQKNVEEVESTDLVASMKTAADQLKINNAIVDLEAKEKNLRKQGKKEEADKVSTDVEKLRETIIDVQAFDSFQKGTAKHLIKLYEGIANGEQKKDMPDNYKEIAKEQVQKIKELESIYNKSMLYENGFAVYMNRAGRRDVKKDISSKQEAFNHAESTLREDIELITEGKGFDISDRGLLFFENEGVDTPEFKAVKSELQELESYEDFKIAQLDLAQSKVALKKLDSAYKKLLNPKTQEKAKREKEKFSESVRKRNEEAAAKQEAEEEQRLADEAKEATIQEQNKKQEEVKKAKQEEVATKENEYEKILKSYNVGESVPIPSSLGEEYAEQEATLKEVDEDKGVLILTMINGEELTIHREDVVKPEEESEVNDGIYSSEGGSNFTPLSKPNKNTSEKDIEGGAKIISRKDDGTTLGTGWVENQYPEYLEYEREPRDKRQDSVGFIINPNRDVLKGKWIKALDLLDKYEGRMNEMSEKDVSFLYAYLPILAQFQGPNGKANAPIETLPYPDVDSKKRSDYVQEARDNFVKHTYPLRKVIIDAMVAGHNISDIKGAVQDQYKGLLQIAPKENGKVVENNILDLHSVNQDLSRVHLYMVNQFNSLVDTKGNRQPGDYNGKGEIYMQIPMVNGEDYFLKLNVRKIQENEAEALYRMYQLRMNEHLGKAVTLKELNKADADFITEKLGDVIDLLATKKRRKDLTLKDITDFLIWDGTDSKKSRVKLEGAKLFYGDNYVFGADVNSAESKTAFIKFLTEEKRHHIKFKPKPNDLLAFDVTDAAYKEYAIKKGILNTNAVVGEPTFQGRTHLYLQKTADVKGKPKKKKVETPITKAATEGRSPDDIHQEIAKIVDAKIQELSLRYIEQGEDEFDALEKAMEETVPLQLKLEKEMLGVTTEVAPEPEVEEVTLPEEDTGQEEGVYKVSNTKEVSEKKFKPDAKKFYRSIGEEGLQDALKSGVLKPKDFDRGTSKYKETYYGVGPKGFARAFDYAPGKTAIIVEVSRDAFDNVPSGMSTMGGSTKDQVDLSKANIYRFDSETGKIEQIFVENIRKSEEKDVSLPERQTHATSNQVNLEGGLKSSKKRKRGRNKGKDDNNNKNDKFCN